MNEFIEPWWYDVDWGKVRDDLHKIVLESVRPDDPANRVRVMQRIVACVNACAGIPSDILTACGAVPNAIHIKRLSPEQQADLRRQIEELPASHIVVPGRVEFLPALASRSFGAKIRLIGRDGGGSE